MRRAAALAALVIVAAVSLALTQGQAPQTAEIMKVKDNLYMIKNGGGNTGAFVTEKGVIVVDTKNPGWGKQILEKIKSVTDKPVTMIINTHTHGDHVSGNVQFPPTVEVVAHENCKASMEKMPLFQGDDGKRFLPRQTYKDKLTLMRGKDRVDLYYFGRGHTSGDTIVVFPGLRVAHTGDLFAAKGLPLIDTGNGGSALEYPKTVMKAAAKIKGVDTVIPGHSDLTDWKTFQEYGGFLKAFADAVAAAHKEGKSADDAAASLKLPERYKDFGTPPARLKDDVAKTYAELKK